MEVQFSNRMKLVTNFKDGIFACNYEDETKFESPGKYDVIIQFGKN